MVQCGVAWCSVLQCVPHCVFNSAACFSAAEALRRRKCSAISCSVLQRVLQCMLQCVAVPVSAKENLTRRLSEILGSFMHLPEVSACLTLVCLNNLLHHSHTHILT